MHYDKSFNYNKISLYTLFCIKSSGVKINKKQSITLQIDFFCFKINYSKLNEPIITKINIILFINSVSIKYIIINLKFIN